ncbi:MAG TPA: hypothetical protein O0X39_00085 [Methanocorpusculum sp.]|nr:hypothetical protein [Methanocorpusculum sp.]
MTGPEAFPTIPVAQDVIDYMDERGGDFRISTTCSGPVLMPTRVKPAKSSDIAIRVGKHILFISRYQIQWIEEVTMDMVPRFPFEDEHEF